jgi:hypothetical protein
MLALVHLTRPSLQDPWSLAELKRLAAEHELVLIYGPLHRADRVIPALRRAMPRRDIVAIVVLDEVTRADREMIEQLLDDGVVPLVLTTDGVSTSRPENWHWLTVDAFLALPSNADACV